MPPRTPRPKQPKDPAAQKRAKRASLEELGETCSTGIARIRCGGGYRIVKKPLHKHN